MSLVRSLVLAVLVLALPSLASALPVFRPGEVSVGAEILPSEFVNRGDFVVSSDRSASPSTGFNIRYSFDDRLALIGSIGFGLYALGDQPDPPISYAFGLGGQFNVFQSSRAAFLFRGGLQFIPRCDRGAASTYCAGDQELGVRLWAGPGVEARVTEALSFQFYTSMMDFQLGGETRFDLEIVPAVGMFLYF